MLWASLFLGEGQFYFSGPSVSTLRIFKGGLALFHLERSIAGSCQAMSRISLGHE